MKRRGCLAICIAIGSIAASVQGAPAPVAAGDDRRAELGRFADAFFTEHRELFDIPGAVFVVVENGETLLASGYGVADREKAVPVDVDKTRFRVASVGKSFTALAVLQLVERGVLDLSGNVNDLLDHPVDEAGLGPITLHQLLVHTAGFDERLIGYLARPGQPESLGEYLSRRMPHRSFEPGDISRYSNHGYALAGLVVEQVSGRPFRLYAEEEVFQPLGMSKTAYLTLPLPAWTAELATEYWASGQIAPLLVSNPYPAGSLATTAGDMKRFLQAFLAEAEEEVPGAPPPVFGGDLRRWMQTVQFTHHPRIAGLTYGMTRTRIRDRDVVLKGGSGQCHAAILGFLPDQGVGFFGAVNRQEPQIWTRLLPRFLELFPESTGPAFDTVAPTSEASVDTGAVEGQYRLARYAESSMERLLSLATHAIVTTTGPDSVSVEVPSESSLGGTFERLSGSVFRSNDGDRSIAFRATGGNATHLFMDYSGEPFAFERVRWDETVIVVLATLTAAGLLFLSVILGSVVRGLVGLLRRTKRMRASSGERLATWLSTGSSLWGLTTLLMLLLALVNWKEWVQAAPVELIAATVLATAVPPLALLWVIAAATAWRRSYWGVVRRLHYTVGALSALVFAVVLVRYRVWPSGL